MIEIFLVLFKTEDEFKAMSILLIKKAFFVGLIKWSACISSLPILVPLYDDDTLKIMKMGEDKLGACYFA